MEDLQWEVAHRESNVPPEAHPRPLEDSGRRQRPQCGWQGGHLPRREGMATQRTATSTHWPPQLQEDVGHLISTLATGLWLGTPRINTFWGNAILGKTELSFEQWYHEVQCVKDHYPESLVWESIVRSLKGAVAVMAWYMGPITSVAHILQKLTIIFGTVASFDVLMQNFYKVTQGNHEKVPSFATRLEGTLNQIRLLCPGRVTDLEVWQYLKDYLFHGVHKHIIDSIKYLYSNPWTSYSQLMVATHKVEFEYEKVSDKIRARAAMTTDPGEGTMELGHQITTLMATLTRAGWGNSPASVPNSPRQRGHGRGQTDRNTPGCPSSHNGQATLGQPPQAAAHLMTVGQALNK